MRTPLVPSFAFSESTGREVHLKLDGDTYWADVVLEPHQMLGVQVKEGWR